MTDFLTAPIFPSLVKKEQNLYQDPHIFRFFELPNEIKFKIIQSIDEEDGKTFTTLLRVSKAMRNICLVSRHRIVRRLPEIINRESHLAASLYGDQIVGLNQVFQTYIRFHAKVMNHTCFLDRFHAMRINKQMYIQGMTADCILTSSDVTCDMYLFQEHLMISGARRWESSIKIRKSLLMGLELDACCFTSTDCDDQTLLNFHCKDITFLNADPHVPSNITDQGINVFLKQWLAGKRELDSFEFGWSLALRNLDTILDGLNAHPIWTEVDHPNSLLRDYPITFIEDRMRASQMNRSYSIWSSSDIYDYRIIEIGDDRLRIEKGPLTEADRMERIVEMFLQ